jgi:hypothetical protein
METLPVLAVDIGGPIMRVKGGSVPLAYRYANQTPGAFDGLRILAARKFGARIHLISQCDTFVQAAKMEWMAERRFGSETGIASERIHFVREKSGKAEVCAQYGVTHFVEDRPEIMSYALAVPNLYLFSPDAGEMASFPEVVARATVVFDWTRLVQALLQ